MGALQDWGKEKWPGTFVFQKNHSDHRLEMDWKVDKLEHKDHLGGSRSNGAEKAWFQAGAVEWRKDAYFSETEILMS